MRENWAKLCNMREIGWKITHLKIVEEESKIFFIIEFQVQSKTGRFSSGIIGELNRLQIF